MDYYAVLELKRDCNDTDIKQAYRRLAVNNHPAKAADKDKDNASTRFRQIAEAYDVLSTPKLRAIYDQYGTKGLKEGAPDGRGAVTQAYAFDKNPDVLFEQFFGTSSPFADMFTNDPVLSQIFGTAGTQKPAKMPTQETNLYCSLEELYHGATKKVKITRQKVQLDGKTTAPEERVLTVEVRPGWKANTKVTFPGDGDEAPGCAPGDVTFVLREKPHPVFTRSGNDLVHVAKITLLQALTGTTIEVPMLDRRTLPVAVADIVSPTYEKVVEGEGMPLIKDPSKHGNLIIRFDVQFPHELSIQQKNQLKTVLVR